MHMGISKEHDELCLESTSTASNALHCLVTVNKLEFATAKLDHTMHEYAQTASTSMDRMSSSNQTKLMTKLCPESCQHVLYALTAGHPLVLDVMKHFTDG